MNEDLKALLLNHLQFIDVSHTKIDFITSDIEQRQPFGWTVMHTDVQCQSPEEIRVLVLMARAFKEYQLLQYTLTSSIVVSRAELDDETAKRLAAFYDGELNMPRLSPMIYDYETDYDYRIPPEERYTRRMSALKDQPWLFTAASAEQQGITLPALLSGLSGWTHEDFTSHLQEAVAAQHKEYYGHSAGTLQYRIYIERAEEHDQKDPDGHHLVEFPEDAPRLVIDVGGTDPILHPVTTFYFNLFTDYYGDLTFDGRKLWADYHRMIGEQYLSVPYPSPQHSFLAFHSFVKRNLSTYQQKGWKVCYPDAGGRTGQEKDVILDYFMHQSGQHLLVSYRYNVLQDKVQTTILSDEEATKREEDRGNNDLYLYRLFDQTIRDIQ